MILLTAQKDKDNDDPDGVDLYTTGTVAVIMRMLKLPDGRIRVLVQGVCRARIKEVTGTRPFLTAKIERLADPAHDPVDVARLFVARWPGPEGRRRLVRRHAKHRVALAKEPGQGGDMPLGGHVRS